MNSRQTHKGKRRSAGTAASPNNMQVFSSASPLPSNRRQHVRQKSCLLRRSSGAVIMLHFKLVLVCRGSHKSSEAFSSHRACKFLLSHGKPITDKRSFSAELALMASLPILKYKHARLMASHDGIWHLPAFLIKMHTPRRAGISPARQSPCAPPSRRSMQPRSSASSRPLPSRHTRRPPSRPMPSRRAP